MVLLMEGPFQFERNGHMVRFTDASGQGFCLTMPDFDCLALLAVDMRAKLRVQQYSAKPTIVALNGVREKA